MDINSYLQNLSYLSFGFNWVDAVIFIVVIFYAFEGYALGFFVGLIDLISFIASFVIGLVLYSFIGSFLVDVFSVPQGFAGAIGFFTVAFISEFVISLMLKNLVKTLPFFTEYDSNPQNFKIANSTLGIFTGTVSSIILLSFILTMIVVLPLSSYLKHSVSDSRIGSKLVVNTQFLAKEINNVFGGAVNDSLSFLTVEPESTEVLKLNFKTSDYTTDNVAENKMFVILNEERASRNLDPLTESNNLKNVARAHCEDMFEKGYFSHNNLEGLTPFDRMAKADIVFNSAGENLAFAPNVDLAMQGLMQSEGHRENILSLDFHRVGVGVIDGGIYGQMFCQEFTD